MLSKRRDSQGGKKKEWGLGRVGEEWHSPDPIRPKPPPFFTPPLLSCRVQFRSVLLNEWLEKACNNKQQLNMSPAYSDMLNSLRHSTSFHQFYWKISVSLACLAETMTQQDKVKKKNILKFPGVFENISSWYLKIAVENQSIDEKFFDFLNTADQIYLTLILSMWYTFSYY